MPTLKPRIHLLLACVAMILSNTALGQQHPNDHCQTQIQVKKQHFQDGCGNQRFFHGVNVMNKQPPYTPEAMGFNEQHMKFIAEQGFNVVRMGFFWAAIEPQPGVYDSHYLDSMSQTITQLNEHGIYVIVDFHQDAYSTKHGGAGFPEWAALGTSQNNNIGFPLNTLCGLQTKQGDTVGNAICEDWDAFWHDQKIPNHNEGVQSRYMKMLTHVSKVLRQQQLPNILGYELMNEPMVGSDWQACEDATDSFTFTKGCQSFDQNLLTPFIIKGVDAIRSADPHAIVFYEPNGLHGLGASSHIPDLKKNNISFSFHHYHYDDVDIPFEEAREQSNIQHANMFMTEFGANMLPLDKFSSFMQTADQYQSSWTYWTYANNPIFKFADQAPFVMPKDPRSQGIVVDLNKPIEGSNVNKTVLGYLSRPYPQSIAGTLISASLTPGKTSSYHLRYLAKPGQSSRIFVPKTFCDHGCHVDVRDDAQQSLQDAINIQQYDQHIDITLSKPSKNKSLHVIIQPKSFWQRWFGT